MSYGMSDALSDVDGLLRSVGYSFEQKEEDGMLVEQWRFKIGSEKSEWFDDGNAASVEALDHFFTRVTKLAIKLGVKRRRGDVMAGLEARIERLLEIERLES